MDLYKDLVRKRSIISGAIFGVLERILRQKDQFGPAVATSQKNPPGIETITSKKLDAEN
jgi:hypothetical protein